MTASYEPPPPTLPACLLPLSLGFPLQYLLQDLEGFPQGLVHDPHTFNHQLVHQLFEMLLWVRNQRRVNGWSGPENLHVWS